MKILSIIGGTDNRPIFAMKLTFLALSVVTIRAFSTLTTKSTFTIPSGLVCLYKPKDWSSSDVVVKIRSMLSNNAREKMSLSKKPKIKVGHGGTLDPLAEGVLVLGIGEGTKLMADFLSGSKGYLASALLGSETDTLDSTGEIVEEIGYDHVTIPILEAEAMKFQGNILQMPPMYSALKRDGKKLYELARQGIEVEREPRPVTVYNLKVIEETLPNFGLAVECSGGFYVRSLISDLAKSCGSRAHMTSLRRTKQGVFTLDDCIMKENWDFDNICEGIIRCSEKAGLDSSKMKSAI